jgi:hypothetical protein
MMEMVKTKSVNKIQFKVVHIVGLRSGWSEFFRLLTYYMM